MATSLRRICRLNISLANNAFFKYNFINVGVRSIFTEQDLGILTYENTRYIFRNQFMTIENTFRDKMQEICQDENGMIYTEDLKAMLHLAQANEDDMQLLNGMLKKYVNTQEVKKYGKYIFGPVVMRMYYHLNQPQYALAAFNNDIYKDNFDYHTAFRILMCLLYKNDMFKEMRETYQKVLDKQGVNYMGGSNVLMYAGCMKEGTPEALEFALGYWEDQYNELKPSIRSAALLSYLAVTNNKPQIALDILSSLTVHRAMSLKGIKMLAYVYLGRYIQIIPLLQNGMELENNKANLFFADVIRELEERLQNEHVEEGKQLFALIDQARKKNYILNNHNLKEFLLRPITYRFRLRTNSENMGDGRRIRNRFSQSEPRNELKNYL